MSEIFKNQRILVLGGAGYIGGAVSDTLFKHGYYNVTVYDSLLFQEDYQKIGFDFIRGDIRDKELLLKILKNSDIVINLAANVGDGASAICPEVTLEVNRDCVKFIADNFSGRIIHMSSCSVYGAGNDILTEDSPTKPLSIYAISKLESENVLDNNDAIIFRLGTIFGLGDSHTRFRSDLVLNTLVMNAFTKKKISVFGGEQYRPLLHVYDAAEAIVKAISIPRSEKSQTFNLACANIQIIDIAHLVKDYFPDTELIVTDIPTEDMRNYQASWHKAYIKFDFIPEATLEDGIQEIKDLLESKRLKDVNNPRYHNHRWFQQTECYKDARFPISPALNKEIQDRKLTLTSVK
jgi:nucleoside-diphosphate-sugar epimerase